jgi:hypothetical protein
MTDAITKLSNYFHVYDGRTKSLDDVLPVLDAVIDHHMILKSRNGETVDFPHYLEHVRELAENGCKAEILEIKTHTNGVEYRLRLLTPGSDVVVHSVGTLDHGKVVQVEPAEENECSAIDNWLNELFFF